MRHKSLRPNIPPRQEGGGEGLHTRRGGARSRSTARERLGLGVKGGGTSRGGGADRCQRPRQLAFGFCREVLTSFPSAGRQCFRVAVILSPYLGDFLEAKLLFAPHPQLWCRATVRAFPSLGLSRPSAPNRPDSPRLGRRCCQEER